MQLKYRAALSGAFALLCALPTIHASPTPDVSSQLSSHFTTLHPSIHPDLNTADPDNLKARSSSSLYYQAHPDAHIQGASLIQVTHKLPTVVLEHSRFVSSVTCNAASTSMVITFNNTESFDAAAKDWVAHSSGFFIASFSPGCGLGTDSAERSFHFVSHLVISKKDLRITCQTIYVPIHSTLHEDEQVTVHVATYRLDDPAGPSPSNVSQHQSAHMANSSRDIAIGSLEKRDFWSGAVNFFKKAGEAIVKVVVAVVKPIARLIPFSFTPTLSAKFDTQSIKHYDTTFRGRPAYKLFHEENDAKTASLDLTCPQCGASAGIYFSAAFVGNFGDGFTQANVGLEIDLSLTLALGIHANAKFSANKDFINIDAFIPGASIVVKGLLELGPAVGFAVGAGYTAKLDGFFEAGFTCSWHKVGGRLDFLDSKKSQVTGRWDLDSACHKILDAEVSATLDIELYTKLSVKMKVAIIPALTGKLTGEVALVEKLSLVFSAAVSTTAGRCESFVPYLSGSIQSRLYVAVTNFNDFQLHRPWVYEIFGTCLVGKAHGVSNSGGGNVQLAQLDAVPAQEDSPPPATDGQDSALPPAQDQDSVSPPAQDQDTDTAPSGISAGLIDDSMMRVLVWNSDGTCSEVDGALGVDTWRADVDDDELIFASSDGRALFINPYITTENGVFGKLAVQNPDTEATGLGPVVIAEPNNSTYAVVVNPNEETPRAYYLAACEYTDGTSQVFVTTDKYEEDGEGKLQSMPNVTGEDVIGCSYRFYHIYFE